MTYLNSELSLERLDTVSGGGGIFGSFFPAILTKEPKSSNPTPTTSTGPNTDNHGSTGGIKSAPFDPVTVRF